MVQMQTGSERVCKEEGRPHAPDTYTTGKLWRRQALADAYTPVHVARTHSHEA